MCNDTIVDMISNKKLNPVITELFIWGRELNIPLVFIMESYFKVPGDVRTKLYTLIYHENSKQKRASTNCN